MKPNIFFFLFN